MRVRCLSNSARSLPESYLDPDMGYTRDRVYSLRPGSEYTVYALTIKRGQVWYYLMDERELKYPVWHPALLFDPTDGRVSRHWVFALHEKGVRDGDIVFAFPEWARNPLDYYDRLSDGESEAQAVFDRYRALMDLEFATGSSRPRAEALGDGWMMCPECRETWQVIAAGELLRCPGCSRTLTNPTIELTPGVDAGARRPNEAVE